MKEKESERKELNQNLICSRINCFRLYSFFLCVRPPSRLPVCSLPSSLVVHLLQRHYSTLSTTVVLALLLLLLLLLLLSTPCVHLFTPSCLQVLGIFSQHTYTQIHNRVDDNSPLSPGPRAPVSLFISSFHFTQLSSHEFITECYSL